MASPPIRPSPAPTISTAKTPFAKIFPRFLDGLPDGGLVMCHPGHVDAELEALDPLTHQREREFAYFSSDEFPRAARRSTALALGAALSRLKHDDLGADLDAARRGR